MELGLLIAAAVAAWVYKDAKDRGSTSAVGWAIGVFFLMIVFLPLYLIRRPQKKEPEVAGINGGITPDANFKQPQPPMQSTVAQPLPPAPRTMEPAPQPVQQAEIQKPAPIIPPKDETPKTAPVHANRPQENSTLCPNCGQYFEQTMKFCPHCGVANKL